MGYPRPAPIEFGTIPLEARQRSAVDRFEEMVHKYPEQVAVRSMGKAITYRDLNQAANRLAHGLLEHMVGQVPVLLYLGQDIPAIFALLGIVKTGRPYVAISPSNPPERNRLIVKDSKAEWIVTDRKHIEQVQTLSAGQTGLHILDLDHPKLKAYPAHDPGIPIPPDSLAYIMYTSGSTNEPKGVMVDHACLMNQIIFQAGEYQITSRDRIALFHNLSFAASRGSVFGALLCGARVSIFDLRTGSLDQAVRWLLDEGITIFRAPPSAFRTIFRQVPAGAIYKDLRVISIGGEAATRSDVSLYRAHTLSSCVFYHRLGSTETDSMARLVVHHDTPVDDEILPVGFPVPDKELLLVDEQGRQVDPDQIGEIVVKAQYLASGYWNRPDLTAQRFHTDETDPSQRIFYTLDLARWRPDGCLEYLGRKDRRVKIRGFQVDLQAVEAVLFQFPAIEDVHLVTVPAKTTSEAQLVAYFTSSGGKTISPRALRQFLVEKIPDHMVPARFVQVEAFSLDPNGKIDSRALPNPPEGTENSFLPPVSPMEKSLAEIWSAVFGWSQVGIRDDFFEMGGDSLLAAEILTEVETRYQLALPLALFLEHRTIQSMAAFLEVNREQNRASSLLPLHPLGQKPPLYLFPGHQGDAFYFHSLADMLGDDRPVYGVEMVLSGRASCPAMQLETTALRYMEEIIAMQPGGPYFLAGHSFGGKLAFEIARQLVASGRQVAFLGLFDTYAPGTHSTSDIYQRLSIHRSNLRGLSWRKRWAYLWDRLNNVLIRGMRDPALEKWILSLGLVRKDVTTINRVASKNYRPGHYSGKITLFRVNERPDYIRSDPTDGWQKYANTVVIREIPGDHASLLTPPQVSVLARVLKDCLDRASSNEMKPAS